MPPRALLLTLTALMCAALRVSGEHIAVKGDVRVSNRVTGKKLFLISDDPQAPNAQCDELNSFSADVQQIDVERLSVVRRLKVSVMMPANAEAIAFQGNVEFNGEVLSDSESGADDEPGGALLSQAQLSTSEVRVNGVQQWALLDEQSFDLRAGELRVDADAGLWSPVANAGADAPQTGEFASARLADELVQANSAEEIERVYENLAPHSYVRIEGNFYFISSLWNGETAYLKVDDRVAWMDQHTWRAEEQPQDTAAQREDLCALVRSSLEDYVWGYPLHVTIRHSAPTLRIRVGSSLRAEILRRTVLREQLAGRGVYSNH